MSTLDTRYVLIFFRAVDEILILGSQEPPHPQQQRHPLREQDPPQRWPLDNDDAFQNKQSFMDDICFTTAPFPPGHSHTDRSVSQVCFSDSSH